MIGIFDSGLGGLTAVKEIRRLLPYEDLVYFGDTGRVPYGTRSKETIIKYAAQDVRFLAEFSPKAVLVACGTVSSTAMEEIRDLFDFPLIGVVEGAAEAAAKQTVNGKIGVIGTSATIKSGAYTKKLKEISSQFVITERACPLFVPLVENGFVGVDDSITRLACEHYLADLRAAGCDTLILGCTHYPLIAKTIAKTLPDVKLISSGAESARKLQEKLSTLGKLADNSNSSCSSNCYGKISYYVSDDIESFSQSASLYLGADMDGKVHRVDIEKY
ncbi:MAG: glutamate racemase [Clostridiales bacterium]|nr:glutamate racemase [Clostridiales bacterium]